MTSTYFYMPSGLRQNVQIARELQIELGAVPVLWMGDPSLDSEAKAQFPWALFLELEFIMLEVKSPYQINETSFSILQSYWEDSNFAKNRAQVFEEYNRYPSIRVARYVERELAVKRIEALVLQAILAERPDFLLSSETPHNPAFLATLYLCRWLGIPTLFFQPTTSVAPSLLPRVWLDSRLEVEKSPARCAVSDASQQFLAETISIALEGFKGNRGSLRQRWQLVQAQKKRVTPGRILRGIQHFPKHFEDLVQRKSGVGRFDTLFQESLGTQKSALLHHHASLRKVPLGSKFVIFPLHFQPERTTVPEAGEGMVFQSDVISAVRQLIPEEVTLIVKEHPSQVLANKEGHWGRASEFYSFIDALPNTQMLSSEAPMEPLFSESLGVFVITGTAGIEAALKRVPVYVLGNPWWAGLPGSQSPGDDESFSLGEAVVADQYEIEQFLTRTVIDRAIPGFGTPSQERFWREATEVPFSFNRDFITGVVEIVRFFVRSI